MTTAQPIIDTHVHLWHPRRFRYSWLDKLPPLNRPFLPADFYEASVAANVEKLIFVEGGADAGQDLAEAAWANELAGWEPRLKGIVAQSTLAPEDLENLALIPLVKGVRPNLQQQINGDGMKWLAQRHWTCDLGVFHPQLPEIIHLAADYPNVLFIIDHCGKPGILGQVFEPWRQHMKTLSTLANVCCKLSGLTTEADHWNWQPSHLQPYLAHVLECFGFDRVLFGSDWPVATLATTYSRWIETLRASVGVGNETELKKLFHDNAERIYRV